LINLSIKQLDRTCLIIVVIAALVCGFLAVRDISTKRRLLETEKSLLFSKSKEIDLAATSLNALHVNLADIKHELDDLNERIPETGKIGLLLQQVDALMKRHKVTLISLEPLTASQEKIYLKNPVTLVFDGNFVNIFHFIRDLEEMNRIMVMEKMTISKQENSDQCRVELITSVFEQLRST